VAVAIWSGVGLAVAVGMAVRVAATAVATAGAMAVACAASAAVRVGVWDGEAVGVGEGRATAGVSSSVAAAPVGCPSVASTVGLAGWTAVGRAVVGEAAVLITLEVAAGEAFAVAVGVSAASAGGVGERTAIPSDVPITSPPSTTPAAAADKTTRKPIKIKIPDAKLRRLVITCTDRDILT